MGEGLHRDGDKVQMKMKAERVFSPSDRRVADLACLELRLHPESGGRGFPSKNSGEIVISMSKVRSTCSRRPVALDLGSPDQWTIQYNNEMDASLVKIEEKDRKMMKVEKLEKVV